MIICVACRMVRFTTLPAMMYLAAGSSLGFGTILAFVARRSFVLLCSTNHSALFFGWLHTHFEPASKRPVPSHYRPSPVKLKEPRLVAWRLHISISLQATSRADTAQMSSGYSDRRYFSRRGNPLVRLRQPQHPHTQFSLCGRKEGFYAVIDLSVHQIARSPDRYRQCLRVARCISEWLLDLITTHLTSQHLQGEVTGS